MIDTALIDAAKYSNPPIGVEFIKNMDLPNGDRLVEVAFDISNLAHVNFIRQCDDKSPLPHLNGYCVSSGCSCRHPNGSKGIPQCGLFKCYESDGVKKDFIYQMFGI